MAGLDLEGKAVYGDGGAVALGEMVEFDHAVKDAGKWGGGASDHGSNFKVRPWVDVRSPLQRLRFNA
ncbi:hypothetical protein GCM10009850_055280 [Nonomuraea monospora]|uniref:Uncharacterized protein n=1 Tax=Nonomuraea monospora TaxID=568818 RepID=A0ABN3CLF0_9ACTN